MLSQGFELSVFLFQMTTVMGLAIATDYGLFILSRYREERASGREKVDAIAGAGGRPAARSSSAASRSSSRCPASCSSPTRSCAAWAWAR